MSDNRHFLPHTLSNQPISVLLVGCGGNGSQMLMGLASLDIALRALSPRSLDVIVIDDDTVSQANLGRQPFYPCDIGRSKAHTLTERVNLAHGLAWTAVHGRAPERIPERCYDLVITCVDSIAARRAMHSAFTKGEIAARYWLDLGNRATDGQFVIGEPIVVRHHHANNARLPTAAEMFPELVDPAAVEDDAPSCSVAEALERQSLFVNRVLASHALALLFELLGRGSITHAGGFVNLATGNVVPIPLAPVRKDQPAAPEVARTTSPEVDNAAQPAL